MNNQYTEKEKEVLISQWEKSGQSQTAWCKAEGFNRRTFDNWVKKHKSRISEPSGETSFIPLELDNTSVPSFKFHYPGGIGHWQKELPVCPLEWLTCVLNNIQEHPVNKIHQLLPQNFN